MTARYYHLPDEDGFTLLEVVVGAALAAMLGVMLLGGLRLGGRIMESAAERTTVATQLSATLGFLRSQIGQAQPVLHGEKGKETVVFDGRSDGVDFVTVSPLHISGQGFQLFSVRSASGPSAGRLIARWQPFSRIAAEAVSSVTAHECVLLDEIASAEFSYLGKLGGVPTWQPRWQGRDGLPSLLRIRLNYAGQRQPDDLVVALRLGQV